MEIDNTWWLSVLRGVILVFFGIFAIAWPDITLVTLVYIFSIYILIAGVISVIQGIVEVRSEFTSRYWFLRLLIGIGEIGIGAYTLHNPLMTLSIFILVISFTFIIRGVLEIIIAFDEIFRNSTKMLLIFGGLLGILAGIILLRYPLTGALAFVWVIGVYALIVGAISIALSIGIAEIEEDDE